MLNLTNALLKFASKLFPKIESYMVIDVYLYREFLNKEVEGSDGQIIKVS